MNDSKLKKLTDAVRKETTVEPPFNFAQTVVAAIHRNERHPATSSMWDQLGHLFPRIAWAAVAVIMLAIASDFYFSQQETALSAELQESTEQWLFAGQ